MTKFSRFSVIVAILFSGLVAPTAHAAGNIYVGTCGPSNQPSVSTIQAGINASLLGGTVWVCPGTYREQVDIDPTQQHQGNIRLLGVTGWNMPPVIITSPAAGLVANATDLANGTAVAAQILVKNVTYAKISGITVDGTGNAISSCLPDIRGIYFQNSSGTVQNVVTQNQMLAPALNTCYSGAGIFVQGGYGSTVASIVHIESSTIQAFQKNGITADGTNVTIYINTNDIDGLGPTSGAQQYGIQLSEGASGEVKFNSITNLIATPPGGVNTANVAVGTLIYASNNVQIKENELDTTQYGILTVSDPNFGYTGNPNGTSNNTQIEQNVITNAKNFDAVDVCSNNNEIANNLIFNSAEAAVHLDSTCGGPSGINNEIRGNVIDGACAAILQGSTPNDIDPNAIFNVTNTVLAGDVCPATPTPAAATANAALATTATASVPRPKPYQ